MKNTEQTEQKLHATNHYAYYPEDEKNIPIYLAYGFRPIFLLLAPYMAFSMIVWGLVFGGVFPIPFMSDPLTWHIYEMLFGVLTAGVLAFLTTGLPELFPGTIPLVGKKLGYAILLWIAGRISFWTIDITGVWLAAFFNIAMLVWLLWFAKLVVLDPLQRHASLGYALVAILAVEIWFFVSKLGFIQTDSMAILKVGLGAIVILVLLALRRVNMEAVNELLEDKGIDDIYISRPPLTNLAIFCVALFTLGEFFYPQNSALGWIGLATGASILAISADYLLKEKFILHLGFVIYLGLIPIMLSLGYFAMGWDILDTDFYALNHFRHFITSGGLGLAYIVVMMIVGWIHTGRHLTTNITTHAIVWLIVIATILRVIIPLYEEYSMQLYIISAILWAVPFILYMKLFFPFLLQKRADGVKG